MSRPSLLDVTSARAALAVLYAATDAADPKLLAPPDWIRRLTAVIRSIVPREEQHRYRLDGFHGITMGRLHRNVAELLHDFDGHVEDNPRLQAMPQNTEDRVRFRTGSRKKT